MYKRQGDESSPDDFYEKFSLSPKLIPHSWVEDDFDGSWTTQYNRKICWFLWYYYNLDWKNGESAEHFVKKYDVFYPQGICLLYTSRKPFVNFVKMWAWYFNSTIFGRI